MKYLIFDSNARASGELDKNNCFVIETDAELEDIKNALTEAMYQDDEDLADALKEELYSEGFDIEFLTYGNASLDQNVDQSIDTYVL